MEVMEDALRILINYPWPGNVRELENVVQRAMILRRHEAILPEDLPAAMLEEANEEIIGQGLRKKFSVAQLEKEYIKRSFGRGRRE